MAFAWRLANGRERIDVATCESGLVYDTGVDDI